MLFSNKPIQFVFFSDEAANAFSDSSRRLLTWAGEGYSDSCRLTTEVAEPARTLWSNCVRILSDQIYKSVHQNEAA